MSLRPQKPHIATGLRNPGKAAGDTLWALSQGHQPHCCSQPWGQQVWELPTLMSHLWQLWDLNQPLEVLQVAGAVEKVLQPARGREWSGIDPAQPRHPAPNVGSSSPSPGSRRMLLGHHAVLECMVMCTVIKPKT